jgi:hypothetical protein
MLAFHVFKHLLATTAYRSLVKLSESAFVAGRMVGLGVGELGAILKISVPTTADSTDPKKTPIFTEFCNSGVVGNAKRPMNRLIVNPIPHSRDIP